MKPLSEFRNKPKAFWASVRSLSQEIGYSKGDTIIVPTVERMAAAFDALELPRAALLRDNPTPLADELLRYFRARSELLKAHAQPNLMTGEEARAEFRRLRRLLKPRCPLPFNKQRGEKRAEAFLTGIVNMLIESRIAGTNRGCDYDPRKLTTFTKNGLPVRTLARRVDGAFPSTVNPVAIWEIKEYYYTTTFGSRVADGVYETLLDGLETEELRVSEGIDVKHYLMVDAHYTWWSCRKSYLCRMVDMLHMGYVDEVLFGKEVIFEMPRIVDEWLELLRHRGEQGVPEEVPS